MFGKRTDMKTLIVYYHPYEGSYCHAILEAVKVGLKKGGHPHKTIDLLRDAFDPVMHEKDLKAFVVYGRTGDITQSDVDPLVLHYKKKLEWAERIVMIFPIWWMNVPAMMKGFIDKVIFPGVAYNMEGAEMVSRLHSFKQVTIISTMNTPADIYRDQFNNSLEGSLVKGTFNQIGIHDVEWISINMVKQSGREKREVWLEEIEERFAGE